MRIIPIIILTIVLCAASVWAGCLGEAVEVPIVNDEGGTFPTYPVKMIHEIRKVYTEAVKGDHYPY